MQFEHGRRRRPVPEVHDQRIRAAQLGQRAIHRSMRRSRFVPVSGSRPHYHEACESAVYMLSGRLAILWGDHLEERVEIGPGDMVYVPPRETHILQNLSDADPAEYVVARDSPTEDSVEVPWAES